MEKKNVADTAPNEILARSEFNEKTISASSGRSLAADQTQARIDF